MLFAAVQYDIAWHNPEANRSTIRRLLDRAALPPGSLALLPEMGEVGFSVDLDSITPSTAAAWAAEEAARRGIYLAVGAPRRADDGMGRNECVLVHPTVGPVRQAAPTYAKVHPFGFGRETEAFRGGSKLVLSSVGPFTACPLICYDLRFPELWRLATLAGADLFLIGASWPAARLHHWRSLLIARAIENQAFVVACNRIGDDPSLHYTGSSMIISPTGDILAEAGSDECVITAECDHAALVAWRQKFPALRDVKRELLGAIEVERS